MAARIFHCNKLSQTSRKVCANFDSCAFCSHFYAIIERNSSKLRTNATEMCITMSSFPPRIKYNISYKTKGDNPHDNSAKSH